jgi:hypothetical protein
MRSEADTHGSLVTSAPVTSTLLLPNGADLLDNHTFTFSKAGVGADGRTTYVATASQSGEVEMGACPPRPGCRASHVDARRCAVTYALGASDYVGNNVIALSGAAPVTISEACTFAGGATAGAAGACTKVVVAPSSLGALQGAITETLSASSVPVFPKTNSAARMLGSGFLLSTVLGTAVLAVYT